MLNTAETRQRKKDQKSKNGKNGAAFKNHLN